MGKVTAVSTADEQEIAEARGSSLPDMLYDVAARAATSSIGQFVYKRIDNLLWTVEKTARWSLPQQATLLAAEKTVTSAETATAGTEESEDVGGTNMSGLALIRPLPWLLFLPALIVLRVMRTVLSVATRLVGRGPVLPATMVSFLQNKRRKLRALKYRGQRLQRISQHETAVGVDGERAQGTAATWLQRIILPLKMVICTGPYRTVDVNSDVAHAVVYRKDRPSTTVTQKRTVVVSKKRNLNQREAESAEEEASDEDSFDDAGCKELLEKYAHVADEDSSFNVEDISSGLDDSTSSQSDVDPSPKKINLEAEKPLNGAEQREQQPITHPTSKTANLKRSASDHKNGIDASHSTTKTSVAGKSIHTANRSKSAAELEKSNPVQPAEATGTEGSSNINNTPSKNMPNLTSSPENNENKPINHNITGAGSVPLKSPSPIVLKPSAKQSPTMGDVRNSFPQQKQPNIAPAAVSSTTNKATSAVQQQQQPAQHPQQQHISNGGKNRNKKPSTQSAA